jgi:PAS domain S-box-containing protein
MSTAVDLTMKALYVKGSTPATDESTLQQLRAHAAELDITVAVSSAAALAEVRRTPGWQALLLSPTLPQNETLALIAAIRRDRVPMAIVPIVDEAHQDLFASAVASGADDVLVRRGQALVNLTETLTRIRQSPHLFPAEQRRRLTVLYAGRDPLVWNLLEQVPFVKAEKVTIGIDGSCPIRTPGSADGALRCDAVVIDEQPGEAHPLQVLKSIKAQASDLPVVVLTSTAGGDIATAALDLGADDTVLKSGIFRRRLIATLRRVHQRLELSSQQIELKAREERLRKIVEHVPAGITVIATDGSVLAMNGAALTLFDAAKPRDIVGRDVRQLVVPEQHDAITDFLRRVTKGEATAAEVTAVTLAGHHVPVRLHGVMLERDARGGRGVIASITAASGMLPIGGVSTTGELAELRDRLDRVERERAEQEQTREADRDAWQEERRALVERLDAAEQALAQQADRSALQDEAATALVNAQEAWARERQDLEARLEALDAAAREAAGASDARATLETELAAAREQLRHTVDAHEHDREAWQGRHDELHERVRALDAAHAEQAGRAAGLADLEREIETLRATHAQEHDDALARHAQLETALRQAREALWAEHGERDAAREASEQELGTLRARLTDERGEWEQTRTALEAQAQAADEHRRSLERDLAAAQAERETERQRALDAFDGERHDWRTTRAQIESAAADAAHRALALESEIASLRSQLDATQEQTRSAFEHERDQWTAERSALETQLREARETLDAAHVDHESRATALDAELRDARAAVDRQQQERDAERADLQRQLHDAQEALDQLRQELDATRGDHESRAGALDAELRDARAAVDRHQQERDAERADLQRQLHDAHEALDRLRQELDTTRGDHESRAGALDAELRDARAAVDRQQQERDAERADLQRQLHDAHETAERLQHELDDVRARHETAHQEVHEQLRTERQTWDAARTRLEADLAGARDAHDAGRQVWDSLRASLEGELHRTREQLGTGQQEWEAARADLHEAVQQLQHRIEDAERDRDAVRARLDTDRDAAAAASAAALDQWRNERQALENELHQARERIDALQRDIDAARRDAEHALGSERQAWDAMRAQLDTDLRAANETLAARQHEWDEQRTSLETLLRRAHDDADSLQRELDATQAQLERDREDTRQSAERVHAEWDAARIALERELDERRSALETLRRDLESRVADLTTSLESATTRASERDHLEAALDAARAEIRHTDELHGGQRAAWDAERLALSARLADLEQRLSAERDQWQQERATLDAQARQAAALHDQQRQLDQALNALRADYATMVQTLAAERAARDQDREAIETLQRALVDADTRRADLTRQLEEAARDAAARAAAREADLSARIRALDDEIITGAQRLARVTEEADAARLALQSQYLRASESHARLVASDVFAYAVTTLPGELVRCNDAFAQLFGFEDAPDALTRTAGRLFPGLSGRPAFVERLTAEGRVDGLESCLDRADGQAIRIVESATLFTETDGDDEALVEHVIVGELAGPDPDVLRARRLEDVGGLTTAMIPEIETLVSTAHERVHDLRRLLRDGQAGGADAEALTALTSQINALVRQLATFSRRQVRDVESVDLADAVTRTEPVLVRLAGDYVGFTMRLEPAPPVLVNPDDLDQLLTSLVTFGRDLLPAGGSLLVEVQPPSPERGNGERAATVLSVTASGYGLQLPPGAPSLEMGAQRCGARLRITGDPGWMARLEVHFTRCGNAPRTAWTWLE